MRTCDKCGCYIPDRWEVCPACGLMTADSGGSGGAGVLLPGGGVNEYRGVMYAMPEEKPELQATIEGVAESFMGSSQTNIYDVVTVKGSQGGNGFKVHFPVPKPRGSIRKQTEDKAAGTQAIMRSLKGNAEVIETELRLIGMGYEKELSAMPPMDQTICERLTAGFRR